MPQGILGRPQREYMQEQRSAWSDYLAQNQAAGSEWDRLSRLMLELQKGGQGAGQRFRDIAEQRAGIQRQWRGGYRQENPLPVGPTSPMAQRGLERWQARGAPTGTPAPAAPAVRRPADAWQAAVPRAPVAPQRTYGWLSRRFNP
jgi:hypothetical protein